MNLFVFKLKNIKMLAHPYDKDLQNKQIKMKVLTWIHKIKIIKEHH
jgi:hypothetical protein